MSPAWLPHTPPPSRSPGQHRTRRSHVSPVSTRSAAMRRRNFRFTSLKLKRLVAAVLDRAALLCHRVCLYFQTLSTA